MRLHELKTWPGSFTAMKLGEKTCDYRKNDRNFQLDDVLHLREYVPEIPGIKTLSPGYTGQDLFMQVTHVMGLHPLERVAFGIPEGYILVSLKPIPRLLVQSMGLIL